MGVNQFIGTALEPRTFTLKSPRSFFNLYAPPDRSPQESVDMWEEEIGFMSKAVRVIVVAHVKTHS